VSAGDVRGTAVRRPCFHHRNCSLRNAASVRRSSGKKKQRTYTAALGRVELPAGRERVFARPVRMVSGRGIRARPAVDRGLFHGQALVHRARLFELRKQGRGVDPRACSIRKCSSRMRSSCFSNSSVDDCCGPSPSTSRTGSTLTCCGASRPSMQARRSAIFKQMAAAEMFDFAAPYHHD
jgi:hypothetical protein